MSFKAKTVLNNDIRVFKKDINSMKDAFDALNGFIREKYELQNTSFIIQYEDEEKDVITIGSSDDLEEAYNQAEQNGNILKLSIVPSDGNVVYSMTTELDKSELEKEKEKKQDDQDTSSSSSSSSDEAEEQTSGSNNIYSGLLKDIVNNKEFRDEFINFITTFIVTLQEDINKVTNDAFKSSLNAHENVSKHPCMQKLIEMFPLLIQQFQPLLFLISKIDVETFGESINKLIEMYGTKGGNCCNFMNFGNIAQCIPMIMQLFNGFTFPHPPPPPPHYCHHGCCHGFGHPPPPPPHHGCCHPPPPPHHGHHHGFGHGHGHGYHHPPPPPVNPFASLLQMFFNLNSNNDNSTPFGPFAPFAFPPPPPPHHHHRHHDYHHAPHGPHGKHFGYGHGHCPFLANKNKEDKQKHCGGRKCRKNKKDKKDHKFKCDKSWKFKCFKQEKCKMKCKRQQVEENSEYNVVILSDDISIADKSYVLPGQVVVKTWRIKNVGKQDIPDGTTLRYYGEAFNPIVNGVSFSIPALKVNEESEVSVILQSPKEDDNIYGKQQATFKLVLPNGDAFGPIFAVRIIIANNEVNKDENKDINNEKEEKDDDDDDKEEQESEKKSEENNAKALKKEEKRKAKLLKQKAKLESKVAKLDSKLNNVSVNINDDLNDIYVNNDKKEDNNNNKPKSPIVIEQSEPLQPNTININDESAHEEQQDNSNKKEKEKSDSLSSQSWHEVIVPPVDDMIINNNNNNNNKKEEQEPIISSNIESQSSKQEPVQVKKEEKYQYEAQLQSLISMGFDNIDYLKQLLNANKGNIDHVIQVLLA
jgi:hypothetical protein